MGESVSVNYHFTASSPTSGWDQGAATVRGQGVTAVLAEFNTNSDVTTTDTVSLSSNFTNATPTTSTARLTSSLAQLLQSASTVDPKTGLREINQGISATLASQVGQLLIGSGFSQSDAANASQTLVQQLSVVTAGTDTVALSLSGNPSQTSGSYNGALSGGHESNTWSVQSTTALSISLDSNNDSIKVTLDQHKIASTKIEWYSPTASNISIALTQPELQAITFDPSGTVNNSTNSSVQESQVTTYGTASPQSVGGSNVTGYAAQSVKAGEASPEPAGIADLLSFANSLAPSAETESASVANVSSPALTGTDTKSDASAKEAVAALKSIIQQLRTNPNSSINNSSLNLLVSQQIGVVSKAHDGSKNFIYTRPTGESAVINIPSVKVRA